MSITEFVVHTSRMDIAAWQSNGSGLPVLMLHGSSCAKEVFRRQFEGPLAKRHRLVAIDLPGHGKSGDAAAADPGYTISGLANTIGEVVDTLGFGRFAIFGWSLGGHVAIQMAAARPDVVGLILTGTPPLGRGPLAALRGFHARWDLLLASKEVFSPRDAERFLQLCFGHSGDRALLEAVLRSDGRLRATFVKSMLRGDGVDQKYLVEHSDIPVAMLNGADDPIVRRSYIESIDYANLWGGRCKYIADAGHAPFWDRPELFNRHVLGFLANAQAHDNTRNIPDVRRA